LASEATLRRKSVTLGNFAQPKSCTLEDRFREERRQFGKTGAEGKYSGGWRGFVLVQHAGCG